MEDDERTLREPMRSLRAALGRQRSPEWRKQQLMAEFDRLHRPARRLSWALAAAAAILVALAAAWIWRGAERPRLETASDPLLQWEQENGFTPVPYSMPAAGEWVYVVRAELNGADLARMGVSLPFGSTNDVNAEILIGQDGLPRAVRIDESVEL